MLQNVAVDLSNKELWFVAVACFLTCVLSGMIAKRDMKTRVIGNINPFEHEPILWAEPGSWWKVPVYRTEKMLFIDCISPSGAFAGIMTWIWIKQYPILAKDSVWAVLCVTALFLLAWTNFALPKYRPQIVDALITLIKAFATFVAGKWGGQLPTQPAIAQQYISHSCPKKTAGMEEPPLPDDPRN